MTREIKFKAWDKFDKKMLYWEDMTSSKESEQLIIEILLNNERYIPLQYTGLKDSEGIEIYEGDNIKGGYLKSYGNYGQQKDILFEGSVKFNFGQFCIKIGETKLKVDKYVYFSQLWPLNPSTVECKIVGNIYEGIKIDLKNE